MPIHNTPPAYQHRLQDAISKNDQKIAIRTIIKYKKMVAKTENVETIPDMRTDYDPGTHPRDMD